MKSYKVITVVGNRPQFVKQAIFERALALRGAEARLECVTINTGQHYDRLLSEVFFEELKLGRCKYELGIGSGPNLDQIGKMLAPLRNIIEEESPDLVLLFGDTNSTLAGSLCAAHCGVPCIHVEGGERLYKRLEVPEEINRVIADHVSTKILASSQKALRYLRREGMNSMRIKYVGDMMLDLFTTNFGLIDSKSSISPEDYGLEKNKYMLATIHRVENTSTKTRLLSILESLDESPLPVLLPMHPRISNLLEKYSWKPKNNLKLIAPLGYFDFLALLRDTALVVSDSGGVTREAMFAGKGCIIPLTHCWWTEAVNAGLAVTVGQDQKKLRDSLRNFRPNKAIASEVVSREFGDGKATGRIIDELLELCENNASHKNIEGPWHPLGCINQIPKEDNRQEFTYKAYKELLNSLKLAGYKFERFRLPTDHTKAICFMRHDIDFDLNAALKIAEIEFQQGVNSTYFIMIRSDHYNPFTPKNYEIIKSIQRMGHDIGLHFDENHTTEAKSVLEYNEAINNDKKLLETITESQINAVSMHRPSKLVLEGDPLISEPLLHSYDKRLKEIAEYISDSRGAWKYGLPTETEAFINRKPIQILTHPIWWNEAPLSSLESLLTLLDTKSVNNQKSFAENCGSFRVGCLEI